MIESKKMDALIDFVRYYAACPCCGEEVECSDGCTFEHDDVAAHEVMLEARLALSQPVQPEQEPVACAWAVRRNDGGLQLFFVEASARRESECGMWRNPIIPLYIAPPQSAQPVQPETQEAAFAPVKVEDTKDAFFRAGWGQNEVMWKCWAQGFAAAQPVALRKKNEMPTK